MRVAFRNASRADSSVISKPYISKMIFDSPGRNNACIMNRISTVGKITLKKNLQYSRATFPIRVSGIITRMKIASGVENHGLVNAINTSENANTTFVIGLRLWMGLSRFTKKDKRSCIGWGLYQE